MPCIADPRWEIPFQSTATARTRKRKTPRGAGRLRPQEASSPPLVDKWPGQVGRSLSSCQRVSPVDERFAPPALPRSFKAGLSAHVIVRLYAPSQRPTLVSATDLSRHLACSHLTSLRRAVAFGELEPPPPYDDPRTEVLRQRGIEHERRLLDRLATDGRTVETVIPAGTPFSHRDPSAAAIRTREAMRRGADVIYQGRLEDDAGRWSGYPDFLLRVDRPSAPGGWSYEVLDTKLARGAKSEALLQLLLVLGSAGAGAGH